MFDHVSLVARFRLSFGTGQVYECLVGRAILTLRSVHLKSKSLDFASESLQFSSGRGVVQDLTEIVHLGLRALSALALKDKAHKTKTDETNIDGFGAHWFALDPPPKAASFLIGIAFNKDKTNSDSLLVTIGLINP